MLFGAIKFVVNGYSSSRKLIHSDHMIDVRTKLDNLFGMYWKILWKYFNILQVIIILNNNELEIYIM